MENSQDSSFKADGYVFSAENTASGTRDDMCPNISFTADTSAVTRRNERERNRVRLVNEGFTCLRQKIPFAHGKKRLSKVETLRHAVNYIKHLQLVIEEHDERFSGDVIEGQGRKTMLRLHGQDDRVSSDVNERTGRKAMLRLMSTRAQKRWKMLMENSRKIKSAHVQPTLRHRIREENKRDGVIE
jgi:hypothetical protein